MGKIEYVECPSCESWSIKSVDGKIVRHSRNLEFVDYEGAHVAAKNQIKNGAKESESSIVKQLVKTSLCPASGKSVKDARNMGLNG